MATCDKCWARTLAPAVIRYDGQNLCAECADPNVLALYRRVTKDLSCDCLAGAAALRENETLRRENLRLKILLDRGIQIEDFLQRERDEAHAECERLKNIVAVAPLVDDIRADNERLRTRIAELEAALSEANKRASDWESCIKAYQTKVGSYEGWIIQEECPDGSLVLDNLNTGDRRHIWAEARESRVCRNCGAEVEVTE